MALILLRGSSSQICPLLNEKTSDNKAHSRSFLTVDDLHLLHGKFWAGIFIILIGIKLYILPFSLLKPYCVVCKAWESKGATPLALPDQSDRTCRGRQKQMQLHFASVWSHLDQTPPQVKPPNIWICQKCLWNRGVSVLPSAELQLGFWIVQGSCRL